MDWVKLAVRYYADPKVAALPDADTELMFVRGLARAGEQGAGGFIPESVLPELARRRRYAACVDALLAAGLWSRVDGGYQITRWADWQDGLDALTRRRTADRERQRRRRAAAREERPTGARAESSPPEGQTRGSDAEVPTTVDNQAVSRDKSGLSRDQDQVSRDLSRDVTGTEGDRDLEGVQVGDKSYGPHARAREEPPPRCPKHIDDEDPPPCGQCADARRQHERWETDQVQVQLRADQQRRSAQARQRAADTAAQIAACRLCDARGYLPTGRQCAHDPGRAGRAGAAQVQAVLDRRRARTTTPPTTLEDQ